MPIMITPDTMCRRQSVGFRSCFGRNPTPEGPLALTGGGATIQEVSEASSLSLDCRQPEDSLAIVPTEQAKQPASVALGPAGDQRWSAANVDEILDAFAMRRAASAAAARKRPAAAGPETPEPKACDVAEKSSKKQKKRQVTPVKKPALAIEPPPVAKPPVLVLGSAKCRGSHGGCAQRRNPSFSGKRYQR